jgi:hypothetical protein
MKYDFDGIGTAAPLSDSGLSGLIADGISVQSESPTKVLIDNSLDRLVTRLEGYPDIPDAGSIE